MATFPQIRAINEPGCPMTHHTPKLNAQILPAAIALTAAATVLVCLGIFAWYFVQASSSYATQVAEHRSIVLSDGSTVALNTRSRIRVRFTDGERLVELLQGQALFHVAKDAARPFIVRSADVRVRAVGTQFDIYRQRGRTIVTVLAGRVAVLPVRATAGVTEEPPSGLLSAGEQSVSTVSEIGKPTPANLTAATAWLQRRMMFQETAVGDVVAEFNRYNTRQLRIDDPHIATFVVSGTFSSTDPASLLRFLSAQPGMRVVESADEVHIRSE